MKIMSKQTVSVKPFSYKGIKVIEAALDDLKNVRGEVMEAALTGGDQEAFHQEFDGDWAEIVKAAKAAGKLPADFSLSDNMALQADVANKTLQVVTQ